MAHETCLVIFDCDGVLVDSEPLAMRVLLEPLRQSATRSPNPMPMTAFSDAASRPCRRCCAVSFELSDDPLAQMRLRLFDLYHRELRPMPGIGKALDALTIPYCVASSSLSERLRISLKVTGLAAAVLSASARPWSPTASRRPICCSRRHEWVSRPPAGSSSSTAGQGRRHPCPSTRLSRKSRYSSSRPPVR